METTESKIAVLKRLREMLARQREKFQAYLVLLESQEASIRRGEAETLLAQVEMEHGIIAEIYSLRKVIAPLETLYRAAYPAAEQTIPRLQATLEDMGKHVIAHNARNRALLKDKMNDLRLEIGSVRVWPKDSSPFAEVTPSLIDITT
jgi:hypothetical protein